MVHAKQIEWMDEIRTLSAELRSTSLTDQKNSSLEEQLNTAMHNLDIYQEELRAQNEDLILARETSESLLKKYSALFDNSPVGYFIIDNNSAIIEVNTIGAVMLGQTQSRLEGKPLFLYLDPAFRNILEAHFRTVASGTMVSDEVIFIGPNQKPFPVVMKSSPLGEHVGKNVRCLTALFDITERKQAEDGAVLARENAEFANRAKSEFLAIMAHELRTPLNAIIGFSDTIINEVFGKISPPKYEEYIGDIHDSGHSLLKLINNLLDLEKVEAGKMELSEEPVDIAKIIKSTLTLVRERAKHGGIVLEVDLPTSIPKFLVDEQLVKQMLLNLVTNAIKFTEPGGSIIIGGYLNRDGGLELSVQDTGVGISEDDLPKVMRSYGQAQAGKHKGTGLGLPIVISMIELHGGSFDLKSTPDEGTTATLRFPPVRTL